MGPVHLFNFWELVNSTAVLCPSIDGGDWVQTARLKKTMASTASSIIVWKGSSPLLLCTDISTEWQSGDNLFYFLQQNKGEHRTHLLWASKWLNEMWLEVKDFNSEKNCSEKKVSIYDNSPCIAEARHGQVPRAIRGKRANENCKKRW